MIWKYESSISKYFMLYKWCLIEFDTLVLHKFIAWSLSQPFSANSPPWEGLKSPGHMFIQFLTNFLIGWFMFIGVDPKFALCFCNEDILVYVCHVHMFYTHWLNILMYQHQQPFHGILTSVTAGPGAAFTWRQASFLHHWRTGPEVSSPSRCTDYVSS